MAKSQKTTTMSDLENVLCEQVDAIRNNKANLQNAKALNQTSNQLLSIYKLRFSAVKFLGKKDVGSIAGLLK